MKDENFSTELNLEARIVAWVLGEASPFEAAELERHLVEHPELAVFKRRIEAVHGLVDEAIHPVAAQPKLSAERRAKLLATFGAEPAADAGSVMALKPMRARPWWQLPPAWMAAAACLMVGLFLLWLSIPRGDGFALKSKSDHFYLSGQNRATRVEMPRVRAEEKVSEAASMSDQLAEEARQADIKSAIALAKRRKPELEGRVSPPAQMDVPIGTAGLDASGRPTITLPAFQVVGEHSWSARGLASSNTLAGTRFAAPVVPEMTSKPALPNLADAIGSAEIGGSTRTFAYDSSAQGNHFVTTSARIVAPPAGASQRFAIQSLPSSSSAILNAPATVNGSLSEGVTLEMNGRAVLAGPDFGATGPGAGPVMFGGKNSNLITTGGALEAVGGTVRPARPDPSVTVLGPTPNEFRAGFGGVQPQDNVVALDQFSVTSAKKEDVAKAALDKQGAASAVAPDARLVGSLVPSSDVSARDSTAASAPATSVAGSAVPAVNADQAVAHPATTVDDSLRAEVQTQTQSISTFSLHVSDVSFRLAQAALDKGELPDRDAIRPEEFYNAFDYGDPAPVAGEPVACRIEQAADPFLQQRNLVRIAMRIPATGRDAGQPLHLTVLLDTSGSMQREDRVATVRQAFSVLASLLGPDDQVTLIGFARRPRLLADRVRGADAKKLVDIVAHTPAEGGTNMEEALKLAGEQAKAQFVPDAQNRIVVLTDGAANLGNDDPSRLGGQVAALRQQGISFDACGIGIAGLDDSVLEALTRKGDGRYYVINSPEEADAGFARKLAGALHPAAQNVKVQVRFNPARVQAYRLIGFEQHRLKTEDFRNDQVTAAELAADEGAVALYQVQVKPDGDGELGDVFVRFRNATTGEMVERSWTLTYESQPPSFDRAAPSMELAGAAAFLAEKLRGGAPAGAIRLADLAPIMNRLRAFYSHDARVQQLVTMYGQTRRRLNE